MSWLNGIYGSVAYNLPSQMIPLSEKTDEWRMDNMDSLENIAIAQRNSNLAFIENYEMIKGKFIFSHYFEDEGYTGMIQQLSKEFEIPNYLRHYDIIGQVVNTLVDEQETRPDIYRVKGADENTNNEYDRVKTELIHNYLAEQINIRVAQKISEAGLDMIIPQSEEESNQLQQQISQIEKSMTPPDIQSYMNTSFFTAAEIWGQHQLAADKQRFSLKEKERVEFHDMLCSDMCFRHFYLTASGYSQETWNPITTFFHKSPDTLYIEDGDYVGRCFKLTLSDIIDRYGFLLSEDDLSKLVGEYKKEKTKWNEASGYDYVYKEYMVPFKGYPAYHIANKALSMNDPFESQNEAMPYLDSSTITALNSGQFSNSSNGYYDVTEVYWKSQEKIGKYVYLDEETGLLSVAIVDENFIVPKKTKVLDGLFSDDLKVNTITYTWVNRVWKGKKINLGNRERSIYFDIKPNEFQFKGDVNIYGSKLPVCGQVFSARNSQSMPLVSLMKPHQIGYNIAMNQLYQLAEKEVGAFMVMDVNTLPNSKDWGGEDSWSKWMLVAKSLGMLPMDTSPQNIKGSVAAAGGTLPRILNLELGGQMLSRMNMAKFFEEQALKQVGFNQYRLGSFNSSTTATGIEQGQAKSYAQTGSYFTNFSHYLKRCYRMNLDIAQYVQSKEKDFSTSYVKSDLSRAYIKVAGTDLSLADLHVYISDSKEELRQLEMMRQLALTNNTSGATMPDLFDIVSINSPREMKQALQKSLDAQEKVRQEQMDMQNKQIETQKEIAQMQEAKLDERLDKKLQVDLELARINASSKLFFNRNYDPSEEDINQATDAFHAEELDLKKYSQQENISLQKNKLAQDSNFKERKLSLEERKLEASIQKQKDDLEYAKILKGKNTTDKK